MRLLPVIFAVLTLVSLACGQDSAPSPTSAASDGQSNRARIEITAMPIEAPGASPLTIPWVATGDTSWQSKELFVLGSPQQPSAKGYAAVTDQAIMLKVVVQDAHHVNHRTGTTIWDGDSLQVGIDALGEGSGSQRKNAVYVGRADASIAFALTDTGLQAFAHHHGQLVRPGPVQHLAKPGTVVRDEAAKTTTYNLVLPWKEFGVSAGASPAIGLAIILNSQEGEKVATTEWGKGAGYELQPGLFNRVYLGAPPAAVNSCTALKTQLWGTDSFGEMVLATTDRSALTIEAGLQGAEQTFSAPAAKGDEPLPRRFIVRGYPADAARPMVLTARMTAGGKTLAQGEMTMDRPDVVVDKVQRRLDELIAVEKNELLARHFRSLKAVLADDCAKVLPAFSKNPQAARELVSSCRFLLEGLSGPAAQWQTYLDRRLPLCLSYISDVDQTVQPYKVTLPPNWDPKKTYPMIVQLHGAGKTDPVYFSIKILIENPAPPAKGTYIPDAYIVEPFGRGNRGYKGPAEKDVFDVMAEVRKQFATDPDRTYLWGHSMGGGGAWAFALHCPDLFAAVGISAGAAMEQKPWEGLGRNVNGLPVRLWHGTRDDSVPVEQAYLMEKELKKYGQTVVLVIAPGAGHSDGWKESPAMQQWLMQFTRKRPDHIVYMANMPSHLGRNGVTMKWAPEISKEPQFDCDIKGNQVRLTVTGTSQIDVDLGPKGLGLTGDVTVVLNGKQVYQGPPKLLSLPVAAPASAPAATN